MPRITMTAIDLSDGEGGYPTVVEIGANLREALKADEMSERLREMAMALMVAMTYHPDNVRDAFGDD
jgi:hypothetical protein